MKIKYLFGLVVAGLCSAQAGDYQWLRAAGGEGAEVSRQIVVDDAGSSYIVGSFNSSKTKHSGTAENG